MQKDIQEENPKELETRCQEYLNNWKRAQADFENYKKNESERVGELIEYEREAMVLNVLNILDSIYLAEKHLPEHLKKEQWIEGFFNIKKQLQDWLKKENVHEIDLSHNGFDPNTMEIIEEVEGEDPGKVAELMQKGYKMNNKIIRPAKVKVTK